MVITHKEGTTHHWLLTCTVTLNIAQCKRKEILTYIHSYPLKMKQVLEGGERCQGVQRICKDLQSTGCDPQRCNIAYCNYLMSPTDPNG